MSTATASNASGEEKSKYTAGLYRIAEQWPALRYLGLGAWWAWIWICYNGTGLMNLLPEGTHADYVGLMYLISTPAIAAVLIVCAVFWRQATHLFERTWPVVAVSVIAALGTVMLAYSGFLGGDGVFALGSALTGLGTSALCLATGRVYGNANIRENLTAGAVSLVFAAFLYYMAMGIPAQWLIPFAALLPVVSAFLYIMPGDPYPGDPEARIVESLGKKAPGRRSFRRLVIASALIAITSGVGKGIGSVSDQVAFQEMGSAATFAIFLLALGIFFYVNVGDIVKSVGRIYAALMLMGVAILLLSCFGLNIGYMTVGKEVLWMLFTCLMAYMVFRFDFSPVRTFGIGQVFYFVASTAAWALGRYVAALHIESMMLFLAILMAFVIMLVYSLVFTQNDVKFILTWNTRGAQGEGKPAFSGGATGASETRGAAAAQQGGAQALASEADDEPGRTGASSTPLSPSTDRSASFASGSSVGASAPTTHAAPLTLHQKIDRLDPVLGVSDREKEVLELFAEGRSANWIAEELTISKNTVRTHIRNCYTKLDVHSRQELLDYFEKIE